MTNPTPNPDAVEAAEQTERNRFGKARLSGYERRFLVAAAEPHIRADERRKVLTELAEELSRRAEAREDDIKEEQLGNYDTHVVKRLRGEGRALLEVAKDCRNLAAKEEKT